MTRVWRIARVAGVDFYVHWSFCLLIPWVILQGAIGPKKIEATIFVAITLALLFGCVALHELGHAVTALRLEVTVKRVILLPIGGLAQIQAVPHKPWSEFLIAAAGPFVNLSLAVALSGILLALDPRLLFTFFQAPLMMAEAVFLRASIWQSPVLGVLLFLLTANIILFVFNLIPTFPMDGGRMVRAVLAMFISYPRATQITLGIGQLFVLLLFCAAFQLRSFELLLITVFVLAAGLPVLIGRRRKLD